MSDDTFLCDHPAVLRQHYGTAAAWAALRVAHPEHADAIDAIAAGTGRSVSLPAGPVAIAALQLLDSADALEAATRGDRRRRIRDAVDAHPHNPRRDQPADRPDLDTVTRTLRRGHHGELADIVARADHDTLSRAYAQLVTWAPMTIHGDIPEQTPRDAIDLAVRALALSPWHPVPITAHTAEPARARILAAHALSTRATATSPHGERPAYRVDDLTAAAELLGGTPNSARAATALADLMVAIWFHPDGNAAAAAAPSSKTRLADIDDQLAGHLLHWADAADLDDPIDGLLDALSDNGRRRRALNIPWARTSTQLSYTTAAAYTPTTPRDDLCDAVAGTWGHHWADAADLDDPIDGLLDALSDNGRRRRALNIPWARTSPQLSYATAAAYTPTTPRDDLSDAVAGTWGHRWTIDEINAGTPAGDPRRRLLIADIDDRALHGVPVELVDEATTTYGLARWLDTADPTPTVTRLRAAADAAQLTIDQWTQLWQHAHTFRGTPEQLVDLITEIS